MHKTSLLMQVVSQPVPQPTIYLNFVVCCQLVQIQVETKISLFDAMLKMANLLYE